MTEPENLIESFNFSRDESRLIRNVLYCRRQLRFDAFQSQLPRLSIDRQCTYPKTAPPPQSGSPKLLLHRPAPPRTPHLSSCTKTTGSIENTALFGCWIITALCRTRPPFASKFACRLHIARIVWCILNSIFFVVCPTFLRRLAFSSCSCFLSICVPLWPSPTVVAFCTCPSKCNLHSPPTFRFRRLACRLATPLHYRTTTIALNAVEFGRHA